MRHFLYVGYYLEQALGTGIAGGDAIELGQFLAGNASGLNWQDFFSNRLGVAFSKYLNTLDTEVTSVNFIGLLCNFLNSPMALNQRPFPNPEECVE